MKTNFIKNVHNYFKEYCSCTSVHGFQYFGEKRTIFERIWWIITFTLCLTACVFSIHAVYKKWERSPVIVNLSNKLTPIHEIPFPAVTVCPMTKFSKDKFNYTDILLKKINAENTTLIEDTYFEYMYLLCSDKWQKISYDEHKTTFPEEFYDVLDSLKPPINITDCFHKNVPFHCHEHFIPVITDEGICYSFNLLDRDDIFMENVKHYDNYHKIEEDEEDGERHYEYPFTSKLPGVKEGLIFTVYTPKDDLDDACQASMQGYKVLVHTPMDIPYFRQDYFILSLDRDVIASVYPALVTLSESVKSYSLEKRRCYLEGERQLKYFKYYTHENCKMECLANFTYDNYNCSIFFMPRENTTQICGTNSKNILREAERFLRSKNASELEENGGCLCFTSCKRLSYNTEMSQTEWNRDKYLKIIKPHRELSISSKDYYGSTLTVYYKSGSFITYEKNELYGPLDFLANFGGLLGLFTGFSIISLMEIIYFLTVRIIGNKILYKHWFGQNP